MKILHVVRDEKFIDMAFRQFEAAAPGQNTFAIQGDIKPLPHVREAKVNFYSKSEFYKILASREFPAVFLHSCPHLSILRRIPSWKTIVWLGFGYDYYDLLLQKAYPDGLLLPETKSLVESRANPEWYGRSIGQMAIRYAKGRVLDLLSLGDRRALARVDYFIPVLETEYEMVRRLNPWFKAKYLQWNIGTIEDNLLVGDVGDDDVGNDILVGNSADPRNNHLEMFALLKKKVELENRKIVVPLSYGVEWYRDKVIEVGRQQFGERFTPLTKFLGKEEYGKVLSGCGFAFMNHLRQQAMGNIVAMLVKGARVYMNPASPAYEWLLEVGCSLENGQLPMDAISEEKVTLSPLSRAQRQMNSEVISKGFSRCRQHARTQKLIDAALEAHC